MMTGKPYCSTNASASLGSATGPGVPGTTGTLFFIASGQYIANARRRTNCPSFSLITERVNDFRSGPNEDQSGILDLLGECCIL